MSIVLDASGVIVTMIRNQKDVERRKMNKEEILKTFKDINHVYNDCTKYDTLKRMLEELCGENWIPVKGKLPDKDDIYLVTIDVGRNKRRVIACKFTKYYYGEPRFYDTGELGDYFVEDVLAWMPFESPEPYDGR